MAFQGYYIKFIKGSTTWIFPMKYMKTDTPEFRPYIVMDLDPWYDANGLLHRNVVSHTSMSMKWETPPMPMSEKEALMAKLRSMYTNKKARNCTIEYYNDETGSYETVDCYMAEPRFRPKERNGITGEILYNGIELEVIKY